MAEVKNMPLNGCLSPKEQTAKWFVDTYIESFVNKYRQYNSDGYLITLSGLKLFANPDDEVLAYVVNRLSVNGFELVIVNDEKNVNTVGVDCQNISKNESYHFDYQINNITSTLELSSKTNISFVGIIAMQVVAQTIIKQKVLYKAIVLDLDGTLWKNTLAEDGIEPIKNNLTSSEGKPYVEFMRFISVVAKELGIFVCVCTRNNSAEVEAALYQLNENTFPLKNQIDILVANYNDKSTNIKEIAEKLSILPDSIVFIDDNQIVRDEVRKAIPGVFVPEWSCIEDVTTLLIACCIFERNELSVNARDRRVNFAILQSERKKNSLPFLFVKVFDDVNHSESRRLYAKSNQFKLSDISDLDYTNAKSIYFELFRPNGDSLGICSALSYHETNEYCGILNWAVSCRFFEIGLEEFVIHYFVSKVQNANDIHFVCQRNVKNQRVNDWIDNYYGSVFSDSCDSVPYDDDIVINHFEYDLPFQKLLKKLRNYEHRFNVLWVSSTEALKKNTNLKIYNQHKMEKKKIYTIGYTLFSGGNGIDLERMFSVLRNYGVTYLADVRSIPFSKQFPQCSANSLKAAGARLSVPYIHIPELGAKVSPEQDVFSKASDIFFDDIFPIAASNRPEKTKLNIDEEIVDFQKFRHDEFFLQGIKRIEKAYDKDFTLALMCSEKEPINCHRYFLVSRKIEQCFGEWLEVEHIVKNKNGEISTITNSQLNEELSRLIFAKEEVKKLNLMQGDLTNPQPKIENYFGDTIKEKQNDFCDRYWNLIHGWKKITNTQNNYDYD